MWVAMCYSTYAHINVLRTTTDCHIIVLRGDGYTVLVHITYTRVSTVMRFWGRERKDLYVRTVTEKASQDLMIVKQLI